MAVDQVVTKDYALYNGDCIDVMRAMSDQSVDLSVYSPPFAGLYNYSSDERDLSNCASYEEFFDHYGFVVEELARLTKRGRRLRGMDGDQKTNSFSHWIWRRYASSIWDDIRAGRVLPFRESRDEEDERHVHPLQLDVIDRVISMRSNPGETVLTPFMGVGSEVYSAVLHGRRGIGAELKPSYFRQAIKNVEAAVSAKPVSEQTDIIEIIEAA